MLSGYKTYIIGAAVILVQVGKYTGMITAPVADTITNALLGGGLMALRAGVAAKDG